MVSKLNRFVFRIKSLMNNEGILRPYNQLLKLGIPRMTAQKMLRGTAQKMDLTQLYKLCVFLNCTPKELIVLPSNSKEYLHENSPLFSWVAKEELDIKEELLQLTPTELEQINQFLKEIKEKTK
jgi:DNA-binding Xre family transcriptional regulator